MEFKDKVVVVTGGAKEALEKRGLAKRVLMPDDGEEYSL